MIANGELIDTFKTDFILVKEHGFSLSEINEMPPYERQIYISLVTQYLEKKQQQMANA